MERYSREIEDTEGIPHSRAGSPTREMFDTTHGEWVEALLSTPLDQSRNGA